MHSLLDSPRDKVLWDVGHQAYPHKVLTGRRDELHTIRKYGGLTPFCSIEESEHDIMGAGHASTSVSYAVGLKEAMRDGHRRGRQGRRRDRRRRADRRRRRSRRSITPAASDLPIVIVVNDNGMSIAPNVGALSRYFHRIRMNPKPAQGARGRRARPDQAPGRHRRALRAAGADLKESLKAYWAPGLFWEELDIAYIGVIDGHDVGALREAIGEALGGRAAVVVHCATVKGKGFAPAEDGGLEGMERWHAAKPAVDRQRRAGAEAGRGRQAPPTAKPRRRSTRRSSARRSSPRPAATSACSASPPR